MTLSTDLLNDQEKFATALFNTGHPCPKNLKTWNGSDPTKRFNVYRNNVISSLIDALADTFPVCCELVGDEFFRAMARIFIAWLPPKSPVLAEYGSEFPDFIADFPPAQNVPYLADVARMETLYLNAYHATDMKPIEAHVFQSALTKDTLPSARLQLQPSISVLRSPYAVYSLWAAHQGTLDLATVDPYQAEEVLIVRPFWEVLVIPVRTGAEHFIQLLADGRTFEESVLAAHVQTPDFDLIATLADLIRAGAVVAVNFKEEAQP